MIAQALADAAAIVAAEGLAKGSYKRSDVGPCGVQHCTVGAIREACGWYSNEPGYSVVQAAAERTHTVTMYLARRLRAKDLHGERPGNEARIIRWNDATRRTADQVIVKLLAAAAHAEAEGV